MAFETCHVIIMGRNQEREGGRERERVERKREREREREREAILIRFNDFSCDPKSCISDRFKVLLLNCLHY
jgi:hypothetical protein